MMWGWVLSVAGGGAAVQEGLSEGGGEAGAGDFGGGGLGVVGDAPQDEGVVGEGEEAVGGAGIAVVKNGRRGEKG